MKKVFASKTRLFANKDVAIIATNSSEVVEINVPDETDVIESEIDIQVSISDRNVILELPDFDHTEIIDYVPTVNFDTRGNSLGITVSQSYSYETHSDQHDTVFDVIWEFIELSADLREKIEMKVDDALL